MILQRNPIRVVAVDPMVAMQKPKRPDIGMEVIKKRRYPALKYAVRDRYPPKRTGSANTNAEINNAGDEMIPVSPDISLSVLRNNRHGIMHGITGQA